MWAQGIRRTVETAGTGREDSRDCSDMPPKCQQAHSWSPWKTVEEKKQNKTKSPQKHLYACRNISLVLAGSGGR